MNFTNVVIDFLASAQDIIDLYFINSALVEINLTEDEINETAHFDAMASATSNQHRGDDSDIPMGKRVY